MAPSTSRLPEIGDWSTFDELTRLQEKQVPTVMGWAARSPFYRGRLGGANGAAAGGPGKSGTAPATLADLESIPLTTKDDLRASYPFGLLAVDKERLATYHESSGSAGTPTASYYTAEDWTDLAERYARKWVGIGPDDIFLVRTPYALMVSGHLAHAAGRLRGATVVPGDNRSSAMPYSRVVRTMYHLGVTLTWSMATETLIWAAAARAAGYEPGPRDFPALRALFVGGDPMTDAKRRRIEELWGVPVVEEYGSTETGSLAGECPRRKLHLWADRAVFEVYRPETGQVSREGTGQLVVTPLFREAMPLLRYNLADDVEVSYAPCACGWTLPTVRVLGRSAFGYPVGRAKVAQHQVEQLVFGLPARYGVLFWRARAFPDRLVVEIGAEPPHHREACGDLAAAIQQHLGVNCDVRAVQRSSLVPDRVLTGMQDVVKPRGLFGPDEDWDKALLYY
jgi:phenylacetate-coenzyme A ligase PaaK-like adenylate-forming protein